MMKKGKWSWETSLELATASHLSDKSIAALISHNLRAIPASGRGSLWQQIYLEPTPNKKQINYNRDLLHESRSIIKNI